MLPGKGKQRRRQGGPGRQRNIGAAFERPGYFVLPLRHRTGDVKAISLPGSADWCVEAGQDLGVGCILEFLGTNAVLAFGMIGARSGGASGCTKQW